MINKIARSVAEALADVRDGATVMIGGFGTAGIPNELIDGLIDPNATDEDIEALAEDEPPAAVAAAAATGEVKPPVVAADGLLH